MEFVKVFLVGIRDPKHVKHNPGGHWNPGRGPILKDPPANFLYKMVGHVPHIKPFFYREFLVFFWMLQPVLTILLFWTCASAFYREHLC